MPPKKRRQTKAPARYGDDASGSAKRTRPARGREKEAPPLTPPAEMTTLHEQMALMQQQIQTITDVVSGMASATVAATVGGARRPAAAAGSAATAEGVDDVVGEAPQDLLFPPEMQSFSAVPLGSLVDDRVKAKVWANQFVELELLVGESAPQTMYLLDSATDRPVVQIRDQPTKKIANIEQWTDAFLIYIAIYTERHPADTPDILKYLQLIRTMSHDSRPSLFLTYDRNFRKLRAHNGMPWFKLHQELFSLAARQATVVQTQAFPVRRQPFPKKQPFLAGCPPGYCYSFASQGRCKNPRCPYIRSCPTCSGSHTAAQCTAKRTNQPQRPAQTPNTFVRRPALQPPKRK